MGETEYEVHFHGDLPDDLEAQLGGFTRVERSAETVLLTPPLNQESLDDLLARLERLGLEMIELRRTS